MKLYVMRHGPAEDHASSGRDFDRALTAPGRERVRDVARALLDEDEAPHAILSSPLVRALQTAEIVAAVTKLSERDGVVETRRELAPGGTPLALVRSLLEAGRKRVMLVGHEPDVSGLVGHLTGHALPAGMQKAMVVGIRAEKEHPSGPMRVRFVLDPKTLAWEHDVRDAERAADRGAR